MASASKYRFSSRYDPSSNCSRAPEAGAPSPIYKGCGEISLCSQRSNAKHGSSTGASSSFLLFERAFTDTCIELTSLDSKHKAGKQHSNQSQQARSPVSSPSRMVQCAPRIYPLFLGLGNCQTLLSIVSVCKYFGYDFRMLRSPALMVVRNNPDAQRHSWDVPPDRSFRSLFPLSVLSCRSLALSALRDIIIATTHLFSSGYTLEVFYSFGQLWVHT